MTLLDDLDSPAADIATPPPSWYGATTAWGREVWAAARDAAVDAGLTNLGYVTAIADAVWSNEDLANDRFGETVESYAAAAAGRLAYLDAACADYDTLTPADVLTLRALDLDGALVGGWDPRLAAAAATMFGAQADDILDGIDLIAVPDGEAGQAALHERIEAAAGRAEYAEQMLQLAYEDEQAGPDVWFVGDDYYADLRARADADRQRIRAAGGEFNQHRGRRGTVYGTTDETVRQLQRYGIPAPAWYADTTPDEVAWLAERADRAGLPIRYEGREARHTGPISQLRELQRSRWEKLRSDVKLGRAEVAVAVAACAEAERGPARRTIRLAGGARTEQHTRTAIGR